MTQKGRKFFNIKTLIFDGVITLIFFVFISAILKSFVPAQSETNITIFALFGGFCLASLFFLALQMFRATLTDQLRRKKK